jgi:hypothetical protein
MTVLHTPSLTPTQQRAAAAQRERARKIAIQAHPDTPIACHKAEPAPPPAPAKPRRAPVIRRMAPPAPEASGAVTLDQVLAAVAAHFSVTVDEIRSTSRADRLIRPRHLAMFIARQLVRHGKARIGYGRLGVAFNRDKLGVRYGIGKIASSAQQQEVADQIVAIRAKLGVADG